MVEGLRGFWSLFHKGTNHIHEGYTLITQSPPQGPTSQHHCTGDRFQRMNLVGDTIPSIDNPSLEYFPGVLADGDSGLGIYKHSKA